MSAYTLGDTSNRVLEHAAQVQAAIDSGQKADGSGPIGDLEALESGLALSHLEGYAYKNAISRAQVSGMITLDEAIVLQHTITEACDWRKGTSLALKVTVTALMAQLVGR